MMAGQNPDRNWKTTDYKISGQLKKLENEQAELLETFDGHLAEVNLAWIRRNQCPQKEQINVSSRRKINLRKTDSNRGNS